MRQTMQYIIQIGEDSNDMQLYAAPVVDSDAEYLNRAFIHFKPLSHEEFNHGLAVVFQTGARYSYILNSDELLVGVEWQPGLLIVKVSLEHELQWVALRSPIPNFGGRVPLPEDGDPEGCEDLDNPQYNLVFTAWDAQFDSDDREYYEFAPAGVEIKLKCQSLLAKLVLVGKNNPTYGNVGYESWRRECIANLVNWCGTGVRL